MSIIGTLPAEAQAWWGRCNTPDYEREKADAGNGKPQVRITYTLNCNCLCVHCSKMYRNERIHKSLISLDIIYSLQTGIELLASIPSQVHVYQDVLNSFIEFIHRFSCVHSLHCKCWPTNEILIRFIAFTFTPKGVKECAHFMRAALFAFTPDHNHQRSFAANV